MSEKIPKETPMHNYIFGWLEQPKTREELIELAKRDFPGKAKKGSGFIENIIDPWLSRMLNWKYPPIKKIRDGKYARIDYVEVDKIVEENMQKILEAFKEMKYSEADLERNTVMPEKMFKMIALEKNITYDENYIKAVEIFRKKYKLNKSLKDLGVNL